MKFYLRSNIIGQMPNIEIDEIRHKEILSAWISMSSIAAIEEEWDVLVQNYVELELDFMRSAINNMVFSQISYHEFQDIRLSLSRRLSNLLQSCRSYLDHCPHFLNKTSAVNASELFKDLTRKAFDDNFGYRFMEAMRNYAQHRGIPLHGATFDSSWTGDVSDYNDGKGFLRFSVMANINLNKVKDDRKFNKKIISELSDDVENLDVSTLAREYIEALNRVHIEMRNALKDSIFTWKSIVREAISSYAKLSDDGVIGLCIVEVSEDETIKSKTNIFDDLLERVEKLNSRNGSLVNLRLRYVSSKVNIRQRSASKRRK